MKHSSQGEVTDLGLSAPGAAADYIVLDALLALHSRRSRMKLAETADS
jgi:hypothetical protein